VSTPISYEVRQQMLDIRQSLERLEGEQKSIERTLEKHPDAAYLSHQIPAIEARRSELAAELAELQAEAVTLATPLDPALSVAETEQHLQKLLALAAEADSELAAVRARLPKFRSTYQAAVLSDEDMGAAFSCSGPQTGMDRPTNKAKMGPDSRTTRDV
jgi:chromosome segregation ATPase